MRTTISARARAAAPAATAYTPTLSQRARRRQVLRGSQAKLNVSQPDNACEREADQVAESIMTAALPASAGAAAQPPAIQRRSCRECEEELHRKAGADLQAEEDAATPILANPDGGGMPLPGQARGFFESRFGTDFSGVRIHHDQPAAHLARSINARACTYRNNIYFKQGQYQPQSAAGQHLLAHELTHVVQQGAGPAKPARSGGASAAPLEEEQMQKVGGSARIQRQAGEPVIMRDLAIEPPSPEAVAALTEDEINAAIRYNTARFQDPYTVMIVRDVVGVPKYPAVSDRDLALAVAQYQANCNLSVDGKVGPATTRQLVRELRAEDQRRFATLLREDNMDTWSNVNGPTYRPCGEFQWDVNFSTTLREGWLIQRIENTWNATNCAGVNVTPGFTARYWEAWWVDANGRVWIPTSTATPPGTAAPATADDLWRNPAIANSTGNWSQAGTLYTTLTLPAGFAARGVPEAMDLPATVGPVRSDDLGLPENYRRVAGRWDCCDADPANRFHRRA